MFFFVLNPLTDELSRKVPSSNSPPLTAARPWDDREAGPFLAHHPEVQCLVSTCFYVCSWLFHLRLFYHQPPFRYSDTECRRRSCSLLHNYQLSDEHIVSRPSPRVQPSPSNSSLPIFHQVLPKNPLLSVEPRHLGRRSISAPSDTEDSEAFERTPVPHPNNDAFAYPPSFGTHGVQRRNSSANYECPYCGKLFSRPSSLKVKIYIIWVLVQSSDIMTDTLKYPHWRKACVQCYILNIVTKKLIISAQLSPALYRIADAASVF